MDKIVQSFFENKKPSPPVFIITYGPPASGKSVILKRLMKDLDIHEDRIVKVLVDEIVESIPEYKKQIKRIVKKHKESIQSAEAQQALQEAYFKHRRESGDLLSDTILYKAMSLKYHIVWETTGNAHEWILKTIQEARTNGYLIFLVYPFVEEEQLIERASKRARLETPRQPPVERITANVKNAQRNFEIISKYTDKSILYDNTGKSIDEISEVVEVDNRFQRWCSQSEKKNCDQMVKCNKKKLATLRQKFEKSYGTYIETLCNLEK